MKLSSFLRVPFLIANAVCSGLLLLSAFAPSLIQPTVHPVWSCVSLLFPIFLVLNLCFILFWLLVTKKYILISLVSLLVCYTPLKTYIPFNSTTSEAKLPKDGIKLLSFNSMMMSAGRMSGGKNAILEYLKKSDADIICIQEYVDYSKRNLLHRRDVNKALKAYPYKKFVKVGGKYSSNKLACFSKYPILSARSLNYVSQYNGSVALRIKVEKDTLLLINNHLESNKLNGQDRALYGEMLDTPSKDNLKKAGRRLLTKLAKSASIRARQADKIAEVVQKAPEKYIVVCGDFNDSPLSYAHHKMTSLLKDAFVESGSGLGISYNQERLYFRIDHIFTSRNIATYNTRIDRSVQASDHYPIVSYLALKK